jgi:hypothetical protein
MHVILTGHAGDGKSTIGLELFKALKSLPPDEPLSKPMLAKEGIRGTGDVQIFLVKDMSELGQEDRLALLRQACAPGRDRLFAVSNTGTLLESFRAITSDLGEWSIRESDILTALSSVPPVELRVGEVIFDIINLVQIDNLGVALEIFRRMISEEAWGTCARRDCHADCGHTAGWI